MTIIIQVLEVIHTIYPSQPNTYSQQLNHTYHPSTQSSTSPPKTDNQTPSSPTSDLPRYAPHTSTTQNPLCPPTAADSSHSAPPSSPGSHPRIPSTGKVSRKRSKTCAFRLVSLGWRAWGMRLRGSGGGSRLNDRGLRRRGGIGCRWWSVRSGRCWLMRWKKLIWGVGRERIGVSVGLGIEARIWIALLVWRGRAMTRRRCRCGICRLMR